MIRMLRRKRLQMSMGLILTTAIIIMGAIWIVFEQDLLRKQALEMYKQQVELIGATTKPAMMFNDERMASELVAQLKVNKDIARILIFSNNRTLLASVPKVKKAEIPLSTILPYTRQPAVEDGIYKIALPVLHKHAEVGHIYVEISLADLSQQQTANIINIIFIIFITWILSFAFTSRLQMQLIESQNNLRKATKKAKRANQAKGDFLSTISHELRTPIHGIIGLQKLVADESESLSPEQRENLLLAQYSAKSLQALVNDVLDLAKIDAGSMEIAHNQFDLIAPVRDAMIPFTTTVAEKKIKMKLHIEDAPKSITGDESRLRQILLNLIGNAVKFTDSGNVSVHIKTADGQLLFSISDSGIGIAESDLERIFEPFTQAKNKTSSEQTGTGLGTSIAKRFVELMDGEISIQSTKGKGTCVRFSLPCNTPSTERFSCHVNSIRELLESPATSNETTHHSPLKILLAEDDPIGQRIASHRLTKAGMQLTVVDNGEDAWKQLQEEAFDLLITDLRMPGMDGIALTKRIREVEKEEQKRHMPIIGLSAHALDEVAEECLKAGMDDFITKPVEPGKVLAAAIKVTSKT